MQLQNLLSLEKYGLKHLQGSLDRRVKIVLPPEQSHSESLVFVSKDYLAQQALERGARVIVKTQGLNFSFPEDVTLFEVPSVSAGMAMILPFFDRKPHRFESSQHNTIHSTAQIGSDVIVGAGTYIGAHTKIGSGTRIGSNVTIENNCIIGDRCIIHPQVFIGAETEMGHHCEIHPHTTLGSDGYGYVTDPQGHHHKIPQLGRVVLEDRVEIGANCAIDRATLTETRIKAGTKLDNLIHIAHNCEIGTDSLVTAGFMTAGSTKIGKNFKTGGQAGVTDHVSITDDVTIGGRTAVMGDIKEPGVYVGSPVMSVQQHLKIQRALLDLPEIWKSWRKQSK